jgi:hypothetical protein
MGRLQPRGRTGYTVRTIDTAHTAIATANAANLFMAKEYGGLILSSCIPYCGVIFDRFKARLVEILFLVPAWSNYKPILTGRNSKAVELHA